MWQNVAKMSCNYNDVVALVTGISSATGFGTQESVEQEVSYLHKFG